MNHLDDHYLRFADQKGQDFGRVVLMPLVRLSVINPAIEYSSEIHDTSPTWNQKLSSTSTFAHHTSSHTTSLQPQAKQPRSRALSTHKRSHVSDDARHTGGVEEDQQREFASRRGCDYPSSIHKRAHALADARHTHGVEEKRVRWQA